MSTSYPISTPTVFETDIAGSTIDFNATGATVNVIKNFVTTTRGDMVFCVTGGTTNTLDRIPIGISNSFLKSVGGVPTWSNFDNLRAIKTTTQAIPQNAASLPLTTALITGGWSLTNVAGITGGFANDGFDPTGPFNATTGIFTVPATGTYLFTSDILFSANNGGGQRSLAFVLSPTGAGAPGQIIGYAEYQPLSVNTQASHHIEASGNFNANDTVGLECKASGRTVTIRPGTSFAVYRLR